MTPPDWRPERRSPLRALLTGRRVEREIDAEIAFHLESRARQLMDEGLAEDEARREARRRFGDRARHRSETASVERRRTGRRLRAEAWSALGRDVRLAARIARRDPLLTLLAVSALGLGVGVTAAVFSVAQGVLLRDLPYPDADRLYEAYAADPAGDRYGLFAHEEILALRETAGGTLAAHSRAVQPVTAAGAEPTELSYARITEGFFAVLGTAPLLGRVPAAEEYTEGRPVVVLAHREWASRFGADQNLVGARMVIGGTPHTVIGVMPSRFSYPEHAAMWRPMTPDERADDDRELRVVVRLSDGVAIEQGAAALDRGLSAVEAGAGVDVARRRTAWLEPARASLVRSVRAPLLALLGAAGLVLLVACVNVSNLLLARGEARRDQIATRRALGASAASLVRQHLTESFVLSGLGCGLGLVLGTLALPLVVRIAPPETPRLAEVTLDGRVVLVMAVIALATTVLTGLAPALRARRFAPARTAVASRRFGAGGAGILRGFVAGQVALSTTLVLGAALLGASFVRLMSFDRGFATDDVLVLPITLSSASRATPGGAEAAYDRIVAEARALAGVTSAHLVYHAPDRGRGFNLRALEPEGLRVEDAARASVMPVTPGYFEAAGIRLVEGRAIAETDGSGAPVVAVASESFARDVLPPGPAVGARFRHGLGPAGDPVEVTVVGVVGDIAPDPTRPPDPILYVPRRQLSFGYGELLVRLRTDAEGVLPALRDRIWAIDPAVPLDGAYRMEQAVAESVASPRFYLTIVGLFAGLALLLAVVGVYGVTSYGVSRRAAEIGVRSALGADGGRILRLFVIDGLRPVLVGIAVGLAAAALAARAARGFLFGVAPLEPAIYAAVAAALAAMGLLATAVPASRAARRDPLSALRHE